MKRIIARSHMSFHTFIACLSTMIILAAVMLLTAYYPAHAETEDAAPSLLAQQTELLELIDRGVYPPVDLSRQTMGTVGTREGDDTPIAFIWLEGYGNTLMQVGDTRQLSYGYYPSDATNTAVIWSSSNTSVLTVTGSGFVTAVGGGTATITATAADGYGASDSYNYTVDDHSNSIVNATTATLHQKIPGKLDYYGDSDFFFFSPPSDGYYYFYTTGTTNTFGELCDPSLNVYTSNDNWESANVNFGMGYYLTVGQVVYIRVSAYGNMYQGNYVFTVSEQHPDSFTMAPTVSRGAMIPAAIDSADDEDYFKFVCPADGTYLIYTTGAMDTNGFLYNSAMNSVAGSGHGALDGSANFALQYAMHENEVYYIRVIGYEGDTGNYTLNVTMSYVSQSMPSTNPDYRNIVLKVRGAAAWKNMTITIDNTAFPLTWTSGTTVTQDSNGAHLKATIDYKSSLIVEWTVHIRLPDNSPWIGAEKTATVQLQQGSINYTLPAPFTFFPYGAEMLAGVDITRADSLNHLVDSLVVPAESYIDVYTYGDDSQIVLAGNSVRAATGMKIVISKNEVITKVYYLVVLGDVSGGTSSIGDGQVTASDGYYIDQYLNGASNYGLDAWKFLAADTDQNGVVNLVDMSNIMNASVHNYLYSQSFVTTPDVPDCCYYGESVAF